MLGWFEEAIYRGYRFLRYGDGPWRLKGHDAFAGTDYDLPGTYRSEARARRAAGRALRQIERGQPSATSGGQKGVQDRIYIMRPDRTSYRFRPDEAR
jgi:hypothetical protein